MRRALATASSVSMTPAAAAVAPSAGPSVVSARDVSKTFGTRKALNGVSVEVAAGEMVALIGPSGSGKSTLLRSITGLQSIDPGKGTISVFGEVVQKNGRTTGATRAARQKLGMIFQQFNLVGRLSLFSNVMLGALGRIPGWKGFIGAWPKADKHMAMAALHRVGVSDYAAQRANTLSGGQQQRGAIARALVQGAKAILADEPVASLDPVSARKVMELLVELNKRDGFGVIVTLHQVDYAIRYCNRVIALKAGEVVYDGPSTGLDTKQLIDIYGPEFEDAFWEAKA
jgi:phosphonate transport system ATP-binding protein